jgi:hypothetical protein
MAKRKRTVTENSIKKRLKEGRGTGRLSEYRPWLHIQDVPSLGLSSRIKGWKTGRVHHLLSLLELLYFYFLEWCPVVIDIREQFPLLPLEETLSIAKSCGIPHPIHPKTKHPIVMTTDFVNTIRRGALSLDEPRTVKYRDDLLDRRKLEKLEIERRYWFARNQKLMIVTEDVIPTTLANNVKWVHPYRDLRQFMDLDDLQFSLVTSIIIATLRNQRSSLRDITLLLDDQLGLEVGSCLALVRHLLANRLIEVDMTKRINPRQQLRLIK